MDGSVVPATNKGKRECNMVKDNESIIRWGPYLRNGILKKAETLNN